MPERLECEVLQKARYINTLTFTYKHETGLVQDGGTDAGLLKPFPCPKPKELHQSIRDCGGLGGGLA